MLKHQLMAECVYAALYAMRDPKGKTASDLFPMLFEEDEDYEDEQTLSDEDVAKLQEIMANITMGEESARDAGMKDEETESARIRATPD